MTRLVLAIAAAVWLLMWLAGEALAQACLPIADVEAVLHGRYGESPRFQGLTEGLSAIWQAWLNEATGTWTIVVLRPDGSACPVIAGQMGALVEPIPAGEEG
ncbi:MAG: hypothetical protein M0R03_22130 [Novosphingobium sp.]|nr:hypothetical protein [Novosphingobium sp.]